MGATVGNLLAHLHHPTKNTPTHQQRLKQSTDLFNKYHKPFDYLGTSLQESSQVCEWTIEFIHF